jgi:hypothetical protein
LAGRLAATLNKSLKGREKRSKTSPGPVAIFAAGFFVLDE